MKNLPVTSKRCLELANVIRDGSTGLSLDMGMYVSTCGTAACVAGHTIFLYDRALFNKYMIQPHDFEGRYFRNRAQELLGLTDGQADVVFTIGPHTPEWAAAMLERYATVNREQP